MKKSLILKLAKLEAVELTQRERNSVLEEVSCGVESTKLIHFLKDAGVIPQFLRNWSINGIYGCCPQLDNDLTIVNMEIASRISALKKEFESSEIEKFPLIIKGMALSDFYYQNTARQLGDIDLIFKDNESLLQYLGGLTRSGFKFDRIKVAKGMSFDNECRFNLQTHFNVEAYKKTDNMWLIFDLHSIAYRIQNFVMLDMGIWENCRSTFWSSRPIFMPSAESLILLCCAHICHSMTLKFRDVNDLYAIILKERNSIDWDMLIRKADSSGLRTILNILLNRVETVYEGYLRGVNLPPQRLSARTFPPDMGSLYLIPMLWCFYVAVRDAYSSLGLKFNWFRIVFNMLVNNGRPYAIAGKARSLPLNLGNVLVYVLGERREGHKVDHLIEKLKEKCVEIKTLAKSIHTLSVQGKDDILISPIGIFFQSDYRGVLSERQRESGISYIRDNMK